MNSSSKAKQIFRLALYGVRSSGKTCILSALSLPRTSHPEGLSCTWIESVPGHPLPPGDSDNWSTDDPFHIGWKWLHDQRNRLRRGELPPPNPNREDAMRFLFAFGAPNQGTRYVELLDYSGELITASASELAAGLRNLMQSCDGLLVLAEVPPPGREQAPLAEDLEKLKSAFLTLLNERDSGARPDWPIALLFNKWDRRTEQGGDGSTNSAQLVELFLNQEPQPPHASLIQTLRNAVGEDNVQGFPVSAFGAHQIRGEDGAEIPLLNGALLQSRWLEDGFVWAMERCDALHVENLERAANTASWFKFWQTFWGSSEIANDNHTSAIGRWCRGVSPWTGISAGWRLSRRFPRKSDFHSRAMRSIGKLGLKLGSQVGVCVLILLLLINGVQSAFDAVRYREVLATKADLSATKEQLQNAERWLDAYFKAPGYFRWLSHPLVLSRADAFTRLVELRKARDQKLWQPVDDTTDTQTKVSLAREYLEAFPSQGIHSGEAKLLVEDALRQESQARNRDYLDNLALQIDAVIVDASTELPHLHSLYENIGKLPRPDVMSDELESQQKELHARIIEMQTKVVGLVAQKAWEDFNQEYNSRMSSKDIKVAAQLLVERVPKSPELKKLSEDFAKRTPQIIREKVRDAQKIRAWKSARDAAAIYNDRNVEKLLSVDERKDLRKLIEEINVAEDQELYSNVRRYRSKDSVDAYLSNAPLQVMKSDVDKYQRWLSQKGESHKLTLTLNGIQWHDRYDGNVYSYRNDITVLLRKTPIITKTGVLSKPNTRSAALGSGQFNAKLNDTITIDVTVIAKYGLVWDSTTPGGSGKWSGTLDQLLSGCEIDLNGDGFTNIAMFSISGFPREPQLPEWTHR